MALVKKPGMEEVSEDEMEMMKHVAHAMCNNATNGDAQCWECVEPCMMGDCP